MENYNYKTEDIKEDIKEDIVKVFINKGNLSSYQVIPAPEDVDNFHIVEMTNDEYNSIKSTEDFNPSSMKFESNSLKETILNRKKAYPSLEEQADMAYWDRKNGTTTLDDAIDAVKLQYPKG